MQTRLDVGGVVREVWRIYVDQAPVLMPAAAVVFVFTGIISGVLVSAGSGLASLAALISFVAGTLFTGMLVELVADVQDGRRDASPGQLLRAVTPVFGQLLLVGIVAGIAIFVGLIALIVPGLILITIWSVAAPVVVLERPPGLRALGRSRELVRGNGWQTFGVIVLLVVVVYVIASLLEIAGESAGTGVEIVVRVVVGVLAAPLSALAAAVLYFALLKARGEDRPASGVARPIPNPFGAD